MIVAVAFDGVEVYTESETLEDVRTQLSMSSTLQAHYYNEATGQRYNYLVNVPDNASVFLREMV